MTIIAGIDDAGRGPVIGPMVLAITAMDEDKLHKLETIGVKDSKLLTPQQRESLAKLIKDVCSCEIIIVPPEEIDAALNDPNTNLNWLEGDVCAKLINKVKPDKVILDCPSPNLSEFRKYVERKVTAKTEIITEHKADLNHKIVGAASIIAKVTRDAEIEKLKKKYKVDFGSGYPSDPTTVEFLKKNYDKYPFFRKTWESYKNVAKGRTQAKLKGF